MYALAGVVPGEGHAHLQNAVDTEDAADDLDQPGYKAVKVVQHGVHFFHAGGKRAHGKRVRARRLCRDKGTAHEDHDGGEDRKKFLGFQKN